MNRAEAYGWLITNALAHLLNDDKGCCPQCCGTCSALIWIRDDADELEVADEAVRATMIEPDDLSEWQRPDGAINWGMITLAWGAPCEFADDHEQVPA